MEEKRLLEMMEEIRNMLEELKEHTDYIKAFMEKYEIQTLYVKESAEEKHVGTAPENEGAAVKNQQEMDSQEKDFESRGKNVEDEFLIPETEEKRSADKSPQR